MDSFGTKVQADCSCPAGSIAHWLRQTVAALTEIYGRVEHCEYGFHYDGITGHGSHQSLGTYRVYQAGVSTSM